MPGTKPELLPYLDPLEVDRPPKGPRWLHEIKWDGYRLQAHKDGSQVTLFTRNGNDWTDKFPSVARAMLALKVKQAILDGEVVSVDANGVSDFHVLRRQVGKANGRVRYMAFDLLWLDGEDLRRTIWNERNHQLAVLLAGLPKAAGRVLGYVEPTAVDGATFYQAACRMGLEGIVSKRIDSTYKAGEPTSGRSASARAPTRSASSALWRG